MNIEKVANELDLTYNKLYNDDKLISENDLIKLSNSSERLNNLQCSQDKKNK